MIIFCHVFQHFNNSYTLALVQFFFVGVYIFFILSGYLYGKVDKKINKKWLINRILKLMIPIYIFFILYYAFNYVIGNTIDYKYWLIYLFNVQIFLPIDGLANLWFISVFMLCYVLLYFVKRYSFIDKNLKIILLLLTIIAVIVSLYNIKAGDILIYIIIYFWGYYISHNNIKLNTKKILLLACVAIIVRVVCNILIDSTYLYDFVISHLTNTIIGLAIITFIMNNKLSRKKENDHKMINYLDEISYYVYIVHYIFLVGYLNLYKLNFNYIVTILLFLVCTFATANILKYLTKS
jgi:peptidoglycan/LPS O-acetylase OafA/YrhL